MFSLRKYLASLEVAGGRYLEAINKVHVDRPTGIMEGKWTECSSQGRYPPFRKNSDSGSGERTLSGQTRRSLVL